MGIAADIAIIVVAGLIGGLIAQQLRQPLIRINDEKNGHSFRLGQRNLSFPRRRESTGEDGFLPSQE